MLFLRQVSELDAISSDLSTRSTYGDKGERQLGPVLVNR